MSGALALRLFRAPKTGLHGFCTHALPRPGLGLEVNVWRLRNLPHLLWGARKIVLARLLRIPTFHGRLSLRLIRADGSVLDYGIASYRVVTTAGVTAIVDAFQNLVELETFIYHGFGTGGTAEAVGDTALVTELTTQYATDNVRPTGSNTETSATVYKTVGTLDPDAAVAITEHGIFTSATVAAGTLLDRSLFSVVNVAASGDTLQATYELTVAAGS